MKRDRGKEQAATADKTGERGRSLQWMGWGSALSSYSSIFSYWQWRWNKTSRSSSGRGKKISLEGLLLSFLHLSCFILFFLSDLNLSLLYPLPFISVCLFSGSGVTKKVESRICSISNKYFGNLSLIVFLFWYSCQSLDKKLSKCCLFPN